MSTTPTLDDRFSAALRSELVDLANDAAPGDPQAAGLASTTAPGDPRAAGLAGVTHLSTRTRTRRRRGTRLALVAATVAIGLVVGTALLPSSDRAYAGWSASPTPLTGSAADTAGRDCAAFHGGGPWELTVAERRGGWTLTMLRGQGDTLATCHSRDGDIGTGGHHAVPSPPAGEITVLDLNGIASGGEPDTLWWRPWDGHYVITGRAGGEVAGIVLHTSAGDVTASLGGDTFLAWWPLRDEHDWEEDLSATITLQDGTSRTVDRAELDRLHDVTLGAT